MYKKNLITATCVALSASLAVAQTSPGTQQSAPGAQQTAPGTQQQTAPGSQVPGASYSAPNPNQSAPGSQVQQNAAGATTQARQQGQASEADKRFVKKAISSSMVGMQSSQMAAEKSETPEVKQTAQQMAQDHAQVGQAIQQIAAAKNIETPEKLETKDQQKLTKLSQAPEGEAFDKAYVKSTVEGHQETIQMFQSAAQQVQDPDLKQLVTQALPLLQRHAQQIAQLPGAQEHMQKNQQGTALGQTATNPGQAQPAGQPGTTQQQPNQPGAQQQTTPQQPTYTGQQPSSPQGNL